MFAPVAAAAVGLYLMYLIVSSIQASQRHARNAARLGCKAPPRRPRPYLLGFDFAYELLRADYLKRAPDYFMELYEGMGRAHTWNQLLAGSDNIMTVDPKNLQALLATQFNDFGLGPRRRGCFVPMLGHGIFTLDGKGWEHSRAMLRPQFARDQISDLELEEVHVQNLLRHLTTDESGWTAKVDLQPLLFRLTLDSATEFLFGESVFSQLAGLPDEPKRFDAEGRRLDGNAFATDWDYGIGVVGLKGRLSDLYWLYSPPHFSQAVRRVNKFADYYVDLVLNPKDNTDAEKATDHDAPERYVFLKELAKQTRDPTELRSQLLNILLAGRDTTAGLLGWTLYTLSRYPDIYSELRKVVLSRFGPFSDPHDITFSNLKSTSQLQHILHEILRIYTNVPINSRQALKDTTLPVGGGPDGTAPIYVRKGQEINFSTHIMHHRQDLWGEDADEFRPSRWEGRKGGWDYLPFNGGPRICLGQQFALTEAAYVLVRLVQKFETLQSADERTGPPKHALALTSSPDAVWLKLKEGEK